MTTQEINTSLIGKKANVMVTGLNVTGTIIGIIDDEWASGIMVELDEPVIWGDDTFTRWHATARKKDNFGNLSRAYIIE